MRRLPPFSSLRAFEAAARHGSFKRAAEELAVTPTAVSHQIRAIEDYLGMPLFERRLRQVVLTSAGRALFPVLRDGFDRFADAVALLRNAKSRAIVRISATPAFIAQWLLPRIARFQAAHPRIELALHASDAVVNLAAGDADLAIRYGRGGYPDLHATLLFDDAFGVVVNPLLKVAAPADLADVPLIHFDWRQEDADSPTWRGWFEMAGLPFDHRADLRYSDESHAIQAAVAGQGAALLSLMLVHDDIAAGRLVQPFGPRLASKSYYIVEASDRTRSSPAGLVREWLLEEALAEPVRVA